MNRPLRAHRHPQTSQAVVRIEEKPAMKERQGWEGKPCAELQRTTHSDGR